MPPKGQGKRLTEEEVALLPRWIKQGAKYRQALVIQSPSYEEVPTTDSSCGFFHR